MDVRIENLVVRFKDHDLYDNFNLVLHDSEFVSVLGKSGCGKTVLLNTILGAIKPDSGKVLVGGKEVTRPRKNISVAYQDFAILPWLTIFENLKLSGATDEVVKANAKLLKIEQHLHKLPKEVSIGIKQRASIARAISIDAEVFLMDEPLCSVDSITAAEIREDLQQILKGKTVVLVTHDIEEALMLSDRIICLKNGEVSLDERASNLDRQKIVSSL